MSEERNEDGRYPWAGPILFAAVAFGLGAFFWWFLISSGA